VPYTYQDRFKQDAERRHTKDINDPYYFVEGYSDSDFGDFYGWPLFYAKGPNGGTA
jgi:hypothetical protein